MKRICLLAGFLALTLPAAARNTVVTILHTNDIHGRILSTGYDTDTGPGGLARIVTMVRAIRRETPNTILLDAGDTGQGTPTEFLYQGSTMVDAMNAAGYDAATLGNHEFDWSQAVAERNIARAKFPVLGANVRDRASRKPFAAAREYVILTRDTVRIAVFGLTTLDTPGIEWPGAISRVRFDDPVAVAKRIVPVLRKRADVLVCLSHLGFDKDKVLAKAVPGIDVIIGGHSHTVLSNRVLEGRCVIAQTGALGANLGRMDIRLTQTGARWHISSINGSGGKWWGAPWPQSCLLPVAESVRRAPDVEEAYSEPWEDTQRTLAQPLGVAAEDIPNGNAGNHSAFTLLLADLLKQAVRTDVAVMPGDYGPGFTAGTVTNGTLYNLIGGFTRQNVVIVRASGAALRSAIEKAYSDPHGAGTQFAGIGGLVAIEQGKARWIDPTVSGRPLDNSATYSVAGGAYPIMSYPSLMRSPLVSDHFGWLKPLLASAIRDRMTLRAIPPTLQTAVETR